MMNLTQDIAILPLRDDLKVYKGEPDEDGSPIWMLYDPLADNYFKIGWFEFECLQRFSQTSLGSQLVKSIQHETTLNPNINDVKDFLGFLAVNGLLRANTEELQKILHEVEESKKASWWIKLVTTYLYIRIPLFQPESFLHTVFPYIKFMFTRGFLYFIIALLAIGIFLTIQRWDEFLNSFSAFFSIQGLIMVVFSTIFVKTIHEFGHAFMAHKYKVPISTMGVVLIVLYPILYTETTNVWKLHEREKRLHVAAAGLMAEMMLAAFALIFWHISEPGLMQNILYFVAFLSFALSILVNLNPLLKFDGYYLLSDYMGIDNLQARATLFFKWKLRDWLWGLKDSPPTAYNRKRERFMVAFGTALVVYRGIIFVGISAIIYITFFKPLDVVLAGVVLAVLIGKPIAQEVAFWYGQRKQLMQKLSSRMLIAALGCVFFLMLLPIQNTIQIPAVMHAESYTELYAIVPAQIDRIHVQNGQEVKKSDVLFSLSSNLLEKEIRRAELQLELYKKVQDRQQTIENLSEKNVSIVELIMEAQTKLAGLLKQKDMLTIKAPFSGVVVDISGEIHVGRRVNQDSLLGRVLNSKSARVTAYAGAEAFERIKIPANGEFKSDNMFLSSVPVELKNVSEVDTRGIAYPELSSLYGGVIPADNVGGEAISRKPLYILKLSVESFPREVNVTEKGVVILEVERVSFANQMIKRLSSLFIRETGF